MILREQFHRVNLQINQSMNKIIYFFNFVNTEQEKRKQAITKYKNKILKKHYKKSKENNKKSNNIKQKLQLTTSCYSTITKKSKFAILSQLNQKIILAQIPFNYHYIQLTNLPFLYLQKNIIAFQILSVSKQHQKKYGNLIKSLMFKKILQLLILLGIIQYILKLKSKNIKYKLLSKIKIINIQQTNKQLEYSQIELYAQKRSQYLQIVPLH
ncbi:hypothetical protein ABPG74_002882 [Tetrahymena malaccensis]